MDGAHDMGGAKGFGPVVPEPNEPVFHDDWERRAFALTVRCRVRAAGTSTCRGLPARTGRRRIISARRYFQIWLAGLETLMIERGLVTREEIEAGKVLSAAKTRRHADRSNRVTPAIRRGGPTERAGEPARDVCGRRDRADEGHPPGDAYAVAAICSRPSRHDRAQSRLSCLPRHQLARQGRGPAMALHRAFRRAELWGKDADPTLSVSVDAWESYLEPV